MGRQPVIFDRQTGLHNTLLAICELNDMKLAIKNQREAARLRGVTLREFAKQCGVSAVQISRWTEKEVKSDPDFID